MQELIEVVQHNCDIVDARYGSDFGMCTYLLKMRELYRWEQGLPLGAPLEKDQLGDWLSAREASLEGLESEAFASVVIDGESMDPFDAESINGALATRGLVYSAGLVGGARPNFFLGELEHERRADNGFVCRVSGREFARCLNAPPAMTRGSTIFLRRESLRRYLWEKYESWLWTRPNNAMARAISCYPFDTALDQALEEMTQAEMTVVEAHEQGEYQAGLDLGEAWNDMLLDLSLGPAELMARAVRDHLADCTHTLPMLVEEGSDASLHFYFANLGAMRKQLFPVLSSAYEDWLQHADRDVFATLASHGQAHWLSLARRLLDLHGRHGKRAGGPVIAEIESGTL